MAALIHTMFGCPTLSHCFFSIFSRITSDGCLMYNKYKRKGGNFDLSIKYQQTVDLLRELVDRLDDDA